MSNNLKPTDNNMMEIQKNMQDELTVNEVINAISLLALFKITAKDIEFDLCRIEKFTEG